MHFIKYCLDLIWNSFGGAIVSIIRDSSFSMVLEIKLGSSDDKISLRGVDWDIYKFSVLALRTLKFIIYLKHGL